MMRLSILCSIVAFAGVSSAQFVRPASPKAAKPKPVFEKSDVSARLKDIARFRGIRGNTISGMGLVVGLDGTGDTQRVGPTRTALINALRRFNVDVDPRLFDSRNAAIVLVSAELPAFATNGQKLDVSVASMGDARSLRNGRLLMCPLYAAGDMESVYATAEGSVSVGGFSVSQNGNSATKGFVTAGSVPAGGRVEKAVKTRLVDAEGKIYLDLDEPDLTTASRVEEVIRRAFPEFEPVAETGTTIAMKLPAGMTPIAAMAKIEGLTVQADTAALIVINEKTGAIVMGGNVKIAPVAFAYGSLTVRVEEDVFISQPAPLSNGQTTEERNTRTKTEEDPAKTATTSPNATVADLAQIFRRLNLSAGDIISILQALKQQGALKARLVMQ